MTARTHYRGDSELLEFILHIKSEKLTNIYISTLCDVYRLWINENNTHTKKECIQGHSKGVKRDYYSVVNGDTHYIGVIGDHPSHKVRNKYVV